MTIDNFRAVNFELPDGVNFVLRPDGAVHCAHTGYRGRLAMPSDGWIDQHWRLAVRNASSEKRDVAMLQGMRTLRQDGWSKSLQGDDHHRGGSPCRCLMKNSRSSLAMPQANMASFLAFPEQPVGQLPSRNRPSRRPLLR